MRRNSLPAAAILALLSLGACAPAPYEVGGDGAGGPLIPAGPGPVTSYAQATGAAPGAVAGTTITSGPITAGPIGAAPAPGSQGLAASPPIGSLPQPGAPLSAVAPVPPPVTPGQTLTASSAEAAPPATSGAKPAGISDEQDFSAVAQRETIESDRQRMERNRAQFQQVAPGALPERTGAAAVSPAIEYAITATNRVGQAVFPRGGVKLAAHDRACARYATQTEAQEAFLRSGGPRRDGRNLDPDGDGFACGFDPTPFQAARGAASQPAVPAAGAAAGVGQGG